MSNKVLTKALVNEPAHTTATRKVDALEATTHETQGRNKRRRVGGKFVTLAFKLQGREGRKSTELNPDQINLESLTELASELFQISNTSFVLLHGSTPPFVPLTHLSCLQLQDRDQILVVPEAVNVKRNFAAKKEAVVDLTEDDIGSDKENVYVNPDKLYLTAAVTPPKEGQKSLSVHQDVNSNHVPFGRFKGMDIYRNRIDSEHEHWPEGYYSLNELVLPFCTDAIVTTFGGGRPQYLSQTFGDVPNVLIVNTSNASWPGQEEAILGNGLLLPLGDGRQLGWRVLLTRPHTQGCLHSKLYVFRSPQGLRLVVSGNNLSWNQQTRQRDVFWVQDFPLATTKEVNHPEFEVKLRTFLFDVTKCEDDSEEDQWVRGHLDAVLGGGVNGGGGVDFNCHKAELVLSLPRPSDHPRASQSGGYKELAEAVDILMTEEGFPAYSDPGSVLYATSGSLGNLMPDFVWRMHQAMNGIDETEKKTKWSQVDDFFRCMWPSKALASEMDYGGLHCMRHMPTQHVEATIPRTSQLKVFHDAIPNPPHKLPPLWCRKAHAQLAPDRDLPKEVPKYWITTHGKFMYNTSGVLYVGSHNFSQNAWGVRNRKPNNVEVGVVLVSADAQQNEAWRRRLPCKLVAKDAVSPPTYEIYRGKDKAAKTAQMMEALNKQGAR